MEYLIFVVVAVVLLTALFIKGKIDDSISKKKFREKLYTSYGDFIKKDYPPGKMENISKYYRKHLPEGGIDDITWNDLGMDDVFKRLNYAYSSAGEEYLYYTLRTPCTDSKELEKRERYINHFTEDDNNRVDLLYAISTVGFSGKYSIYDYIDTLDTLGMRNNLHHYINFAMLAVAVAACFYSLQIGLVAVALVISYCFVSYFKEKKEIDPYITSFSYIMRLLDTADAVEKIPHDVWNEEWELISNRKKGLNKFRRGSYVLMSNGRMSGSGSPIDIILDYFRMMFHIDLIKFNNMLSQVREHLGDLDNIISAIGYLEMTIAAGAFRKSLDKKCVPEVGEKLEIVDGCHPLMSEAVPNSIRVERGVLLTGSNASGKSTFLKMVALNTLLAQTVHTVCADSFSAPLFRIFSSMALKDNLVENESYYIVEIKSIKRIIDSADSEIPVLCFVDEVLRGTNTVERISASTQILKQLAKEGIICFAATHDIELAELLKKYYDNYHFEEEIDENDVKFSYRLMNGKATTRNAIKLLRVMGYNDSLIEAAEKMSAGFLESGTWDNVSYE